MTPHKIYLENGSYYCRVCRAEVGPFTFTPSDFFAPGTSNRVSDDCDEARRQMYPGTGVSRSPLWRVGTKLGRTLYRNNICIGMVDTAEIAQEIVDAMNGRWT